VCVCVCMFEHNSATPGATSTKLGTHMAVCMYKNLMYILFLIYIYIYMYMNGCLCVCLIEDWDK
jgi:hypothetical protein